MFYHKPLPKSRKYFFAAHKPLRFLKHLRVLTDWILFRFHSDKVLRFLSDRVLLRVLFESSVTGFSSGSPVIDSSLRSSVPLFRPAANFLVLLPFFSTTTFFIKTDVLFYIKFSKESSHLTITSACFNNFSKTDSEKKIMKYLHDRDTKYYLENGDAKSTI